MGNTNHSEVTVTGGGISRGGRYAPQWGGPQGTWQWCCCPICRVGGALAHLNLCDCTHPTQCSKGGRWGEGLWMEIIGRRGTTNADEDKIGQKTLSAELYACTVL